MKKLFAMIFAILFTFTMPAFAGPDEAMSYAHPELAPAKPLAQCAKDYGTISVEERPATAEQNQVFTQAGFSPDLVIPLARHTISSSKCFTIAGRDAPRASWALRVSVQNPNTVADVSAGAQLGRGFASWLGIQNRAQDPILLVSVQVTMTVVDLETGEPIASVIGNGAKDNIATGSLLLSTAKGALANQASQTPATQTVAAGFVDALNQVAELMNKAYPAK